MLIINADDFGRSVAETEATIALVKDGRITSASAMVFMKDSERAAALAPPLAIDIGLHLNFCERWNGPNVPTPLAAQQAILVDYFKGRRYAHLMYNPKLRKAFQFAYDAQIEEFHRLYGRSPSHVDGHHHLHLCANMLVEPLIPRGFRVRRNFSFAPWEKGLVNRTYRKVVDACLRRRYVLTDYFFSLERCLSGRGRPLSLVAELARDASVEIMTHPANTREFDYLAGKQFHDSLRPVTRGPYRQPSAKRIDCALNFAMLMAGLSQWL